MGKCQFCGKPAGFLRTGHTECQQKHDDGPGIMQAYAEEAFEDRASWDRLEAELATLARDAFLPASEVRQALIRAWGELLHSYLEDDCLTADEQSQLEAIMVGRR